MCLSDHVRAACLLIQLQQLFKEASIWKRLDHPNVLKFLGLTKCKRLDKHVPCMISLWAHHESIMHYLAHRFEVSEVRRLVNGVVVHTRYRLTELGLF